jgi:hypothetical protein
MIHGPIISKLAIKAGGLMIHAGIKRIIPEFAKLLDDPEIDELIKDLKLDKLLTKRIRKGNFK